ncbi:MAG: hypothetical protein ACREEM_34255 [Blastocatellia bacterium]
MKRVSTIALALALLLLFPSITPAQKKRPAPRRRPAGEPAQKSASAMDMRPEALAVAEQIKNVSKFIFIYGKIVNGLEVAEDQAKRGEVTPAVAAKTQQSKDALINSIRGLRAGIENVSKNMQANPRMQVQYLKLSYAAEAVSSAEKLATAGRFDDAGKALTLVVERLTETLLAMRLL